MHREAVMANTIPQGKICACHTYEGMARYGCSRKATVFDGGKFYCTQHSPEKVRERAGTEHTGQTPNGSSATTEKRGAPNPEFACWLMGFPVEFINGVSLAMQSYQSSRRKSSLRSLTPSKVEWD